MVTDISIKLIKIANIDNSKTLNLLNLCKQSKLVFSY